MENQDIAELVKKFDNFVQSSLTRKDERKDPQPSKEGKVQSYLREMEKRLKLRPRSHEQRFEKLLKPMKELKSFVSVREFMETLGTCVVGRVGERGGDKGGPMLKLQQGLQGKDYLDRIEQYLRSKQFKRSARNPPFYVTELEEHSLQNSEYRAWVQNALTKITSKNDHLFKKADNRISQERSDQDAQQTKKADRDCLIEEHQKEYADQFKVVPHMRELCTQEYESFAKISSLLTGRLRKILKNNCAPRSSIASIKSPAFIEGFGRKGDIRHEKKGKELRPEKSYLRKTTRFRESKENLASFRKAGEKKRVQTAGTQRREDDGWREMVTTKLKCIINQSGQEE